MMRLYCWLLTLFFNCLDYYCAVKQNVILIRTVWIRLKKIDKQLLSNVVDHNNLTAMSNTYSCQKSFCLFGCIGSVAADLVGQIMKIEYATIKAGQISEFRMHSPYFYCVCVCRGDNRRADTAPQEIVAWCSRVMGHCDF